MREKMIMTALIIGTWMIATANAGNMEVVSTHRFETGEGVMRTVAEDIDIVLNQWPVWDQQELSEYLVQEYLDNTLPGYTAWRSQTRLLYMCT